MINLHHPTPFGMICSTHGTFFSGCQDPGRTWPVLHNIMALVLGGKHRWNEMLYLDLDHKKNIDL